MKRKEPITKEDIAYNSRHNPINQKAWIEKCLFSNKLNTWELNFLGNIEKVIAKGYDLSDAQAETLEKIYAEKT